MQTKARTGNAGSEISGNGTAGKNPETRSDRDPIPVKNKTGGGNP